MSTEQNLNWRRSPNSPVGAGAAPPPSSLASGDHQLFCISFALLNLGGLLCSIDRLTSCFFSLRLCGCVVNSQRLLSASPSPTCTLPGSTLLPSRSCCACRCCSDCVMVGVVCSVLSPCFSSKAVPGSPRSSCRLLVTLMASVGCPCLCASLQAFKWFGVPLLQG